MCSDRRQHVGNMPNMPVRCISTIVYQDDNRTIVEDRFGEVASAVSEATKE